MKKTIYIGYDSSNYGQKLAFDVCKKSLLKYNQNLNIIQLNKKELENKNIFKDKIVTEVNINTPFYTAEEYHHDYFSKNPQNPYCQAVINPKLAKLRLNFSHLILK